MKLKNMMPAFDEYRYASVRAKLPEGNIECVSLMFGCSEENPGVDLYLSAPDLKECDGRFTLAAGAGDLRVFLVCEALSKKWNGCGDNTNPSASRFYDKDLYIAKPAIDDKGGFCASERWKVKDWLLTDNRIVFIVEDPAGPEKDVGISSPTSGDEKQTYVVTYVRYGFVQVTASSPEEAERIADGYTDEDISWSDNYEQVSIEKTEDY